jgi:transposase
MIFSDESGFTTIPNAKATWSPRGQTPVLRVCLKRGRLNALAGLVVSPKQRRINLHALTTTDKVAAEEIVCFMAHLMRRERGLLFWFWDGAPIHDNAVVRRFLAQHSRVRLIELPAYAPELNPAEGIWAQAVDQLSSKLILNLHHLASELAMSLRRTRDSQQLLWACISASNLPWQPSVSH